MQTKPGVYEGQWEELAAHGERFAGRRVRLTILAEPGSPGGSPEERRAFLNLPLQERRRLLSEQAERMLVHYENDSEWREWLQGDIVEY